MNYVAVYRTQQTRRRYRRINIQADGIKSARQQARKRRPRDFGLWLVRKEIK